MLLFPESHLLGTCLVSATAVVDEPMWARTHASSRWLLSAPSLSPTSQQPAWFSSQLGSPGDYLQSVGNWTLWTDAPASCLADGLLLETACTLLRRSLPHAAPHNPSFLLPCLSLLIPLLLLPRTTSQKNHIPKPVSQAHF